jgi:hypothetical protein
MATLLVYSPDVGALAAVLTAVRVAPGRLIF